MKLETLSITGKVFLHFISYALIVILGGVNTSAMNSAEREAFGWHYYFKAQNVSLEDCIFMVQIYNYEIDLINISQLKVANLELVTD